MDQSAGSDTIDIQVGSGLLKLRLPIYYSVCKDITLPECVRTYYMHQITHFLRSLLIILLRTHFDFVLELYSRWTNCITTAMTLESRE